MNTCPYCNNDMSHGHHISLSADATCSYRGVGQTAQERHEQCSGYQLGSLVRGTESQHNGAGCYDNDMGFA